MENMRLKGLREGMAQNGIGCVLIYSDVNRNYLTGFTGDESYIVVTPDEAIFITDSRYTEQASKQVAGFEVRRYDSKITDTLIGLIKSLHTDNLGFENSLMTYDMYEELKTNLEGIAFIKLNGLVENLRIIKDNSEIEKIQKAANIADEAFSHMLGFIKQGMTEKEVGLELEFYMRRLGASGLSFTSIVASGSRSSLPHGTASDKVIEHGDFLTLDFGCVYEGYCSDMTRTVVIGEASKKQEEIYNIVLKANEEALKEVKPGITGAGLDMVARKIIAESGYGENFGHGLGHGVGMQIHELPFVSSKKGSIPLKAGMVITDEPGIYLPGFGGVRIEDLVLVTGNGCRVMSSSPKNLIIIK
jgi:Xaa-Pro aminopeptidase